MANGIELVYTPTTSSWLSWIECEFTAARYCTLDGSDYPSHTAQEAAIAGYPSLAQPLLPPETPLRSQLQDPPPGLPTQRCLMRH